LPDQVAAMDINVRISARVMVRMYRLKAMFHQIRDYPAGLRTSERELRIGHQLRHGHGHHARALTSSLGCWVSDWVLGHQRNPWTAQN